MNQRVPTSTKEARDKTDMLSEASSKAEKANQIGGNYIEHAPVSAAKDPYEEYRAEIFGNKLRAARNR